MNTKKTKVNKYIYTYTITCAERTIRDDKDGTRLDERKGVYLSQGKNVGTKWVLLKNKTLWKNWNKCHNLIKTIGHLS